MTGLDWSQVFPLSIWTKPLVVSSRVIKQIKDCMNRFKLDNGV